MARTPTPKRVRRTRATRSRGVRAADLPGARKQDQPQTFKPQLATLVGKVPEGENWLHEVKFDGYRMLCLLRTGKARLLSRNRNDWTWKLARIAEAGTRLPVREAILDGEVVVLRRDGSTDFQALQNALKEGTDANLVHYVFDVPHCDGYDLTRTPLVARKQLLRHLLAADKEQTSPLRYSDRVLGDGPRVYARARAMGLEGIISKRADSAYISKRAPSWVKVKCVKRQLFVVGGYTEPSGSRVAFGALLLGQHDKQGRLVYCGQIGTGLMLNPARTSTNG